MAHWSRIAIPVDTVILSTLIVLQTTLAAGASGLYGLDLANSTRMDSRAQSQWIYAEVVCAFTLITCIVYCIPTVNIRKAWPWELVLTILWATLFGVFGDMYLSKNDSGDQMAVSRERMMSALWMDMICMLLWFGSCVYKGVTQCVERKAQRRNNRMELNGKDISAQEEGLIEYRHQKEKEEGNEIGTSELASYDDGAGKEDNEKLS